MTISKPISITKLQYDKNKYDNTKIDFNEVVFETAMSIIRFTELKNLIMS